MTSSPENKITRSDLIKSAVNVGALGMEFSWTYYKQMNIAFCLMVANMLKKIYAGRPDDYAEALHRHSAFFNITPQLAPFVGGIAMAMEEKVARGEIEPESVNDIKAALMGPLSGLGDSFFLSTLRVVAAAVGISLCQAGNVFGPIAFLLIMPDYRCQLMKLVKLPRYFCGVAAQFFYVGVQIAVWTWTIKYIMSVFPGMQEAAASNYYIFSIILFIACRAITTALMKKFNPANMMSLFAVAGILCCLGTIYLPREISVWTLVGISGCMSLMFPTIYGIALRGLGSEVKLGAAGLIMAILGGAVITPYMGSWIDNTTVKNQVAYFESINRPLIAQAEAADARKSLSGAMLALYRMSEASPADGEEQARAAGKFQKNLETFFTLPSLEGDAFEQAAKSLPGCSSLKPRELAVFKANLERLPAPAGREQQIQQFSLIPALSTLSGNQAEVLDNLIALPLDMKQFQTAQENFVEKAVRSSFFIPIICFAVVLIYGFFFRNTHLKKEEEEKPAQA